MLGIRLCPRRLLAGRPAAGGALLGFLLHLRVHSRENVVGAEADGDAWRVARALLPGQPLRGHQLPRDALALEVRADQLGAAARQLLPELGRARLRHDDAALDAEGHAEHVRYLRDVIKRQGGNPRVLELGQRRRRGPGGHELHGPQELHLPALHVQLDVALQLHLLDNSERVPCHGGAAGGQRAPRLLDLLPQGRDLLAQAVGLLAGVRDVSRQLLTLAHRVLGLRPRGVGHPAPVVRLLLDGVQSAQPLLGALHHLPDWPLHRLAGADHARDDRVRVVADRHALLGGSSADVVAERSRHVMGSSLDVVGGGEHRGGNLLDNLVELLREHFHFWRHVVRTCHLVDVPHALLHLVEAAAQLGPLLVAPAPPVGVLGPPVELGLEVRAVLLRHGPHVGLVDGEGLPRGELRDPAEVLLALVPVRDDDVDLLLQPSHHLVEPVRVEDVLQVPVVARELLQPVQQVRHDLLLLVAPLGEERRELHVRGLADDLPHRLNALLSLLVKGLAPPVDVGRDACLDQPPPPERGHDVRLEASRKLRRLPAVAHVRAAARAGRRGAERGAERGQRLVEELAGRPPARRRGVLDERRPLVEVRVGPPLGGRALGRRCAADHGRAGSARGLFRAVPDRMSKRLDDLRLSAGCKAEGLSLVHGHRDPSGRVIGQGRGGRRHVHAPTT
mmetsp:Transcript_117859/g.334179  ORF Transcript_117859/g.334179 Transcript_117859/m.334179 type:complete len:675 (+) Transcript_117859:89-2113(+)